MVERDSAWLPDGVSVLVGVGLEDTLGVTVGLIAELGVTLEVMLGVGV